MSKMSKGSNLDNSIETNNFSSLYQKNCEAAQNRYFSPQGRT